MSSRTISPAALPYQVRCNGRVIAAFAEHVSARCFQFEREMFAKVAAHPDAMPRYTLAIVTRGRRGAVALRAPAGHESYVP